MRWTQSDIETFWAMKREGASLIDIADRFERDYKAVANLQYSLNKKKKIMEEKPMKEETQTTAAPEQKPAPEAKPALTPEPPELPKLDAAAQAALAMITAQGFALDNFTVTMDGESASISICFSRETKN